MSQLPTSPHSPYANLHNDPIDNLPQRTSVLAIISLVIAIVSVVPLFCIFLGSGALAVIFGGAALLFINRERGRLSGTGLAATGIVIGLLVTVLQIVVVMMASRAMQFVRTNIVGPIDTGMAAIDKGDLTAARKMFTPAADAQITDQMLIDFAAAYQARVGAYQGLPTSMLAVFETYGKIGPGLQSMQGRQDTMPLPANFARGEAALLVTMDQQANQSGRTGGVALPVLNLGIATPDGKTDWLIDPKTLPPVSGNRVRVGPGGIVEVEVTPDKPDDEAEKSPSSPPP